MCLKCWLVFELTSLVNHSLGNIHLCFSTINLLMQPKNFFHNLSSRTPLLPQPCAEIASDGTFDQQGSDLLRTAVLAGYRFLSLPVFCLDHPLGKPADYSPGREPYNKIEQFHMLPLSG
jgi:hypothetical protein